VQGEQLQLELVDVAVINDVAVLVVDRELPSDQFGILNIEFVWRLLWLRAGRRLLLR